MKRPGTKPKLPPVSQFLDMPLASWQTRSCGIAALATLVGFHTGEVPGLNELRRKAVANNAYQNGIGWRHKNLAELASAHNLSGKNFDWASETDLAAWKKFQQALTGGPVIVSIYKDFKPSNGGHLIVASRITNDKVFYNEPASKTRKDIARSVSIKKFRAGWKKRIISIGPSPETVYVS
jgi:hypothetical protein